MPEAGNGGGDILVVDDNADLAQSLGWMLEFLGHEARVAHTAAAALAMARTRAPRVVLLDIGLPGMDGYEACRQMRAMPGLENTVFIAQTGWGQERHRSLSREAGFDHHLVKPIELRDLQALLASLPACSG